MNAPTRLLIVSACLLTACAASTAADLPPPHATLLAPCIGPVTLPDRALTQADVATNWGADRATNRDCATRHALLAEWVRAMLATNRRWFARPLP